MESLIRIVILYIVVGIVMLFCFNLGRIGEPTQLQMKKAVEQAQWYGVG